jgi:hypothetical protein
MRQMRLTRSSRLRVVAALLMLLIPILARAEANPTSDVIAAPPSASSIAVSSSPNLLANADFAKGSGKSPDHWRTGGWNESPSVTDYEWLHAPEAYPELSITNFHPNDARWLQSLSLAPGWYYVSAEVSCEDVPPNAVGAYVSLDEDSINSPGLHGNSGWQRVGLYLKVGPHGADVDIALRLGGFGSLNTGRAFFRNAKVVKIEALPANAAPRFDLAAVRRSQIAPPVGRPWTLPAVFALLVILTIAGWRIYGAEALAPAPVTVHPAAKRPLPPRSQRRRQQRPRHRR